MRPNPQKLTSTVPRSPLLAAKVTRKFDKKDEPRIWDKGQPSTWGVTVENGVYTATLPYPLSGNECMRFCVIKGQVRAYESAAFVEYKALIRQLFIACRVKPTFEPVKFVAKLYRPQASGDIDNRIKPLWDSLNGNAWKDDRQVKRLVVDLLEDPSNPRVEVTITPHAAANGVLEFE